MLRNLMEKKSIERPKFKNLIIQKNEKVEKT
jgi:hypothetical protein